MPTKPSGQKLLLAPFSAVGPTIPIVIAGIVDYTMGLTQILYNSEVTTESRLVQRSLPVRVWAIAFHLAFLKNPFAHAKYLI